MGPKKSSRLAAKGFKTKNPNETVEVSDGSQETFEVTAENRLSRSKKV